jgi:hypothetical protein
MGNKIITEKDFWMCTMGAVPAQLQGTRKGTKKENGALYITVEDKATSSWIDFGCKKYMLLMALAAAAAIVILAVVGVLTVATGGLALVALGAVAGLVGAAVGAVAGACLCGQKVASKRVWSNSKSNFISQGTNTITGDHFMTCAAGGIVKFAPNIKSWTQAVSLGALNYVTGLAEGALAGAAVGLGGGILSGAFSLAMPTLASIGTNIAGGFTGIFGASRVLFGADALANDAAMGRAESGSDALSSFGNGAIPEYGSMKRILTGTAQPADAMLLLYLLHLKAPTPKETVTPKEEPTAKPKEEEVVKPTEAEAQANTKENNGKKGEAFEDGTGKPRYGERRISDELYDELRDLTPTKEIRDLVNKDKTFPMDDPALPGKQITKKLHADHIVPMDKISRMEGFEKLTKQQQLEVLNNPDNFIGLSESANTSKGAKSFEEWTTYKKENIQVDPEFRRTMIEREGQIEGQLQKQIDDFLPKTP